MSNLDKFADTKARERLSKLFDEGTFVEVGGYVTAGGRPCGVVCGYGAVNGAPAYAFAQDPDADGGAVGKAHAAKVVKLFELAHKTGTPVIGVYDSRGALVSEGVGALDAYGEMILGTNNLSGVVPRISLVLGVCAGSSAMMACCADFIVMSEKAELFAVPGSTESASAKAAAKAGIAHIVREDEASAIEAVRGLVSMLPLNNLAAPPVFEFTAPQSGEETLRAAGGASAEEIVAAIFDEGSAVELLSGFGDNVYAAMAALGGFSCGIAAVEDGGALDSDCCNKIAKLVSVWDSFQIPVITFVNAGGLEDGGEIPTALRDMAKLAHVYAEATSPKAAVITGKAYGSAYVALAGKAVSDYTVAWPSAVISPLPPQAAVAFSYADRITPDSSREAVTAAYIENEASAYNAAENGYIDDVIDPGATRSALISVMDILSSKRVSKSPKKHGNIPF